MMKEHDYSYPSKKDVLSEFGKEKPSSLLRGGKDDNTNTCLDEVSDKKADCEKGEIIEQNTMEPIPDSTVQPKTAVFVKSENIPGGNLKTNEVPENVSEPGKKRRNKIFPDDAFSLLKPVKQESEMEDDEVGEYFFETDHLALRGNQDYLLVLKTIAILEAQRVRAIKDFERLIDAKEKALADPVRFVEKLQRGEDLNLPSSQRVQPVPVIDWDKYLISFKPNAVNNRRIITRRQIAEPSKQNENDTSQILANSLKMSNQSNNNKEGRSWTVEEQKRLEDLLSKFPSEEVESRRWEKIAQALGNRSKQQVASRVQKYFIKLTKAGLPVPGRTPNISNYVKRGHSHRHHRHNRYLFQPSTFLASYEPPVYMGDNDDDTFGSHNISTTSSIDGDTVNEKDDPFNLDDEISSELKNSEEYKELMKLAKLRKDRIQSSSLPSHVGFKCDACDCEPIIGTRWHCADCPPDSALDFCEDCNDCLHETSTHSSTHRLIPIAAVPAKPYIDRDYTSFMPGNYNYLDPNYKPAT